MELHHVVGIVGIQYTKYILYIEPILWSIGYTWYSLYLVPALLFSEDGQASRREGFLPSTTGHNYDHYGTIAVTVAFSSPVVYT